MSKLQKDQEILSALRDDEDLGIALAYQAHFSNFRTKLEETLSDLPEEFYRYAFLKALEIMYAIMQDGQAAPADGSQQPEPGGLLAYLVQNGLEALSDKSASEVAKSANDDALVLAVENRKRQQLKVLSKYYYLDFAESMTKIFPKLEPIDFQAAFRKNFNLIKRKIKKGTTPASGTFQTFLTQKGKKWLEYHQKPKAGAEREYQIIESIQCFREDGLADFYENMRDYFIKHAQVRFPGLTEEKVIQAFMDSLEVLIEYIRKRKIRVQGDWIIGMRYNPGTKQYASLKTFLVSIGIRILSRLSDDQTIATDPIHFVNDDEFIPYSASEDNIQLSILRKAFQQLKPKCKDLLRYRFQMGLDYETIKDLLNSKSAVAARVEKRRCILKLKAICQKLWSVHNNGHHGLHMDENLDTLFEDPIDDLLADQSEEE